jgi:hypothetical protein
VKVKKGKEEKGKKGDDDKDKEENKDTGGQFTLEW